MKRIDLNQKWKMKKAGTDEYIPAAVPGSVYNDLINAGLMDDPYYRDNEDDFGLTGRSLRMPPCMRIT